ncbi:PREDICTED: VWFA and cache domain-containing protein 1 [Vollenhovia emeryi]|uniref:VWFA and cache domain-containing protein 1 n=1 Tax=Vollenhovia emeryi TaxID=411798 RepID=UPI0005F557AD|nr:PREDICTED: VWFA and cache domain-containing protein 1 [Vollenhovia emeryi]XP_011875651.1 PREDICTED: VWFA and cache domain-containing protein 1 [Vollenhovia emeryi]
MITTRDARCRCGPNSAGMAVNKILYFGLALVLTNLYVAANNGVTSVKCQFGKPMRKQVSAEPLNGMCLRDIASHLSKTLQSIVDEELGASSFQKMIDKMEFVNASGNLDAKISALVDKFDNKLMSYINIFKQVYKVIYNILTRNPLPAIYSSQIVDYDMMEMNRVSDICTDIMKELATQLRGQEWKNMHILPINEPEAMCGPPTVTHNIGSLLLSQYCPEKNVVLLLEHGVSMSEPELTLIQITAKTIVDMLSEMDNVTVVGLANSTPLLCKDSLLRATDINKFQLTRYIDSLTRTDSSEVTKIDFRKLTQNLRGEVLIMHLTNKVQNISNVQKIFEIISGKFKAYLKTVIVTDQHPSTVIKKLNNDSIVILPMQNVLGYEIGKLFSCLQCLDQQKKDFYVSDPYIEPYSKTMMISIGQVTKTALLSLDIKLRDFLDDITYFNVGPNVHAIFFDSKGVVWMHKNFPRIETIVEQSLKVHLQDIENIDSQIVLKMINESKGIMDVYTKLGKQKRYRWKHLIYHDLIICLVSTTEERVLPIARIVPPLPANMLHHRLDLMLQTIVDKNTLCIYRNKIVTLSMGVIYLSPWCFQSPIEQLKQLETGSAINVQSYMAYIKDVTGLLANPGLHPSVKPDVAMLAQVLEHFKKQHVEGSLNKFVIRRYITSTVSGVLEIFPGMILDSNFDPKRRMWYGKALEQLDKIILTPPYLDAGGSGYVITLSKTVKYSVATGNANYAIAILSMDVTMGYVMRLLMEMFPFCYDTTVKCFLMDDKGYLVSHPKLLEATDKIEQQHLTHKELLVANDILNHGLFVKKKSCANYLDGTVQRYYQFNTSLDEVLTNIAHGEHCVRYQVAAVPGTNVFLGVVNMTTQCNLLRAFCPCSTMDHSCLNCKSMEQTGCECPCECSLYSFSCTQQITNDLDSCPPTYEQGSSLQTPWIESMNLKPCPSINCKSYTTKKDCLGIVDCQWCHVDNDGETPLQQPFCSDMSVCFKGILGAPIPYSDGTYNSQATDEISVREWPSVGPVAGGILALFLIVGVILFCYRLRSVHSSLEHQCLHLHTSPDTLRMTHIEGDPEPAELDQTKNNLDCLVRDTIAPISPYRVSTNYRRPPGGDSDHGYSTMTPHDDSEQQTFASEPLLAIDNNVESDLIKQSDIGMPSLMTYLGSPHHVLAPVTVHRDMETNYC